MNRLFMIRHGESESNAGGRTDSPNATPITAKGLRQAETLALSWDDVEPTLIVTSPFLRTKQTSAPFAARFPSVPVTQWRVEEFTHLTPSLWKGTTHSERMPSVRAYWERSDPWYRDGEDAESFADMLGRVRDMFIQALDYNCASIVVFTHGTFTQAAIWSLLVGARPDAGSMRRFQQFAEAVPIPNAAVVPFTWSERHWCAGFVQGPA